jgi:hypothetical protein
MPQLSPTSNSHFFSPSGSVTESQTSHRDAAVVKAGSSCWIPLKESTLGLKYPQLNGASETPHGEWGCDGGAGLCMLKPDDSGRCSILLLKNAQGTHDEGLWSVPKTHCTVHCAKHWRKFIDCPTVRCGLTRLCCATRTLVLLIVYSCVSCRQTVNGTRAFVLNTMPIHGKPLSRPRIRPNCIRVFDVRLITWRSSGPRQSRTSPSHFQSMPHPTQTRFTLQRHSLPCAISKLLCRRPSKPASRKPYPLKLGL